MLSSLFLVGLCISPAFRLYLIFPLPFPLLSKRKGQEGGKAGGSRGGSLAV